MKIKEKWVKTNHGEVKKLIDADSDAAFRRILGGLGWPYAKKPGFVVIMGEEFEPDHSLPNSPHHYHILAEHETSNLEELLRICTKFDEVFCLGSVLGNPENPIYEIWKQMPGHSPMVTLPYDFEKIDFNLVTQLVQRNTEARKTLHLRESSISRFLFRFMADSIENELIEHYPPMAAFGFVLAQMELHGGFTRPHFRPDRSGVARTNRGNFTPRRR